MKRLKLIAIFICVMLSSMLFSACGDKYRDLSMSFYIGEQEIEAATLYMDENGQNQSADLNVVFTGISAEDVGNLYLYTDQAGLIEVTNTVLSGNTYYFTITANNPTTSGAVKLNIKHLSSGKTASIDLTIERKSTNLTLTKSLYVMDIPSDGVRTSELDSSQVLRLTPEDSTDDVYFCLATGSTLPTGVTANYTNVNGEQLITSFNISSSVINSSSVMVCPVTTMQGYQNTTYTASPVTIMFFNTLSTDELIITSAVEEYNPYLLAGEPIVMLNDNLNTLNLLNVTISTADGLQGLDWYVQNIYSSVIERRTSSNAISVEEKGDFNFDIVVNSYMSDAGTITFTINPNSTLAGEIQPVQISMQVKGENAPTAINLTQDDNVIYDSSTLDIYDYYSNGYGSKFQFSLTPASLYEDLSSVRLTLPLTMLNANINGVGNNPVFNMDGEQILDSTAFGSNPVRTNNMLLNFYLNTRLMSFYYDAERGLFVSEPISQQDVVYIMYVDNPAQNTSEHALSLTVESFYSGELDYLQSYQSIERVLTFNSQEGVQSFDIIFGYWNNATFESYSQERYNPSTIYLDRAGTTYYGFTIANVVGVGADGGNENITNTEFSVLLDGITLYVNNPVLNNPFTNPYVYNTNSANTYLTFVLNEETEIGNHTLTILHANGVEISVTLIVYETLTEEDIQLNLSGTIISNRTEDGFIYADYEVDYIVAVGDRVDLEIDLNQLFVPGYVTSYNYEKSSTLDSLNDSFVVSEIASNLQESYLANTNLVFNQGSYDVYEGSQTVYLTIIVQTQRFDGIFLDTTSAPVSVSRTLSFFAYERVDLNQMSISTNDNVRYSLDSLAYTLTNLSLSTFTLTMPDSYYNYIQTVEQTDMQVGATGEYKVVWDLANTPVGGIENNGQNSNGNEIQVRFTSLPEDLDFCTYTIRAQVMQFGVRYTRSISITVTRPVLTEEVVLENIDYSDDIGYYVNVMAGSEFEIEASNISSFGTVTNPGTRVYILNESPYYQTSTNYGNGIVTVDGNTISVAQEVSVPEIKLIVFATDVLISDPIGETYSSIEEFKELIINGQEAYFVLTLVVSTGDEANPFLISSPEDLLSLSNSSENTYFQVMNDISLSGFNQTIVNCNAHIRTYDNNQYLFSGFVLSYDYQNLFTNFTGEMQNITFSVTFSYSGAFISSSLGVISENFGTLENVAVTFAGNVALDGTNSTVINFGALVGSNSGAISYSKDIIGASGSITLRGASTIIFGSLVGFNEGTIAGYNYEEGSPSGGTGQTVIFSGSSASGVTSSANITSSASNANSAIGGLIGRNVADQNGAITFVSTTGSINATTNGLSANNLGGVIGINDNSNSTPLAINFYYNLVGTFIDNLSYNQSYNISNVTSNVTINAVNNQGENAGNNIGGIVGSDTLGRYFNCRYQVYALEDTAISGGNNVGGIAGYSQNGLFENCSVMSYRWDYFNMATSNNTFEGKTADILGNNYVGGIIGNAVSTSTNVNLGDTTLMGVVVVNASSANASLQANVNNTLSGISSLSSGLIIINDAYFMGKFEGTIEEFALTNNQASTYHQNLYTVYVQNSALFSSVSSSYGSNIQDANSWNLPWNYDASLNGGYVYIVDDNGDPLFDISPTGINATVKTDLTEFDSVYRLGERTISIDFYQFDLDETDDDYSTTYNNLVEEYNTYNILDLVDISVDPSAIDVVNLTASSTNSAVVEVNDGQVIVRGVGNATLILTSVLSSQVYATIEIQVQYPLGNEFMLTTSLTSTQPVEEVVIQTNRNQSFYLTISGSVVYDGDIAYMQGNSYSYRTIASYQLRITSAINPSEYINIQDAVFYTANGLYTAVISPNFNITAIKAGGEIELTITPIVVLTGDVSQTIEGQSRTIKVTTATGPTAVNFNQTNAVVYPDYQYTISLFIKTDTDLTNQINSVTNWFNSNSEENSFGYWEFYLIEGEEYNLINNLNDYLTLTFLSTNYNSTTEQQLLTFAIRFNSTTSADIVRFMARFNVYGVEDVLTSTTRFNLIPQAIDNLNIKNYITINGELVQRDTIQPFSIGRITIDTVPSTGYYDYLEIKDITGQDEISFAQIDEEGNRLGVFDTPTDDGLGIVLVKRTDENGNALTTYVATEISSRASSIIHTIEVSAYLNDGTLLCTTNIYVAVRLLPTVSISYYSPKGELKWTEEETNTRQDNLAVGTNARFRISTYNSDGNIDPSISITDIDNASQYYTLNYIGNGYYDLTYIGTSANIENLVGKTLTLTVSTTATLSNGVIETGSTTVNFELVNFVIHSVSLTNSRTANGVNEIYGNFNQVRQFEFYFASTDISYYNSNVDYYYVEDLIATNVVMAINNILGELNSGEYLLWFDEDGTSYTSPNDHGISYDSVDRTIVVSPLNTITSFAIQFNLYLDAEHNFAISNDIDIVDAEITQEYNVNFAQATTLFEPEVIENEEDFLRMPMGSESNYILARDLTLDNYTPMSLDVGTFDGNGHTITINSFSPFSANTLEAGLFTTISSTTVLMNLQVEYAEGSFGSIAPASTSNSFVNTYVQLGVDGLVYDSVSFGGIAVTNNGVITNCKVIGTFAVEAPNLVVTDLSINFFVGGLVTSNSGYITNSISELRIASIANVGGFVYENSGHISSSAYVARAEIGAEKSGVIYIYYGNQDTSTVKVEVGGFVVNNSGNISMSYVDVGTSLSSSIGASEIGNMSTKDVSAGFVYNNSGNITNSYVNMDMFGVNSNTFSGFVVTNNGEIDRSYTYINGGRATNDSNLFAQSGTTGITNSYIIIHNSESSSATNGIEGLTAVKAMNMYATDSYQALTFGDGENAVWIIQNTLPRLVSTLETTPFTDFDLPTISEDGFVTTYDGFKTITRYRIIAEDGSETYENEIDNSNYGTETYPFIIYDVETWNYYFSQINSAGYFRIVRDIDFNGTTPLSVNITFQGNIQGNDMDISNILLYTQQSLDSIGLFATLEDISSVKNAIRNLSITNSDIRAVQTKAVGTLAGVAEGYDLYNITLDSSNIILGNNAVGGLVGIIRGQFDVESIATNVSANSAYDSSEVEYDVYLSVNNGQTESANLDDLSYAGSLFGVADAYDSTTLSENRTTNRLYSINDITIEGSITLVGETVGGAIGMLGEKTHLSNVTINITGNKFSGYQYSAGAVGENRGIVDDVHVMYSNESETESTSIFNDSHTTVAGLVGLNLGGLVMNSSSNIDIIKTNTFGTVGIVAGLVGRNIGGSLYNSSYTGNLLLANSTGLEITSALVGTMYSNSTMSNYSSGLNKISSTCSDVLKQAIYYINSSTNQIATTISDTILSEDIIDCSIAKSTIKFMIENLSNYYTYYTYIDFGYEESLSSTRILGLAVGLADGTNFESLTSNLNYGWSDDWLVINGEENSAGVGMLYGQMYNGVDVITPYVNVLDIDAVDVELNNYILYMIAHSTSSFDSWDRSTLNGEMLLLTDPENENLHYIKLKNLVSGIYEDVESVIYTDSANKIRYSVTFPAGASPYIQMDFGAYEGRYYQISDTKIPIPAEGFINIYIPTYSSGITIRVYDTDSDSAQLLEEFNFTFNTL